MQNSHYRRVYKLRLAKGTGKCVEVTFPFDVVEKEARKHELTVEQFMEQYQAVALYNGFDGVNYQFEKILDNNKDNNNATK